MSFQLFQNFRKASKCYGMFGDVQEVLNVLVVPFESSTAPTGSQKEVFQLQALEEHGGLSIDLDVVVVKPISPLLYQPLTTASLPAQPLSFALAQKQSHTVQGWLSGYNDQPLNKSAQGCEVNISPPNYWRSMHVEGALWHWKDRFAVDLCSSIDPRTPQESQHNYDPRTIRILNTTAAEVLRYIY